jgi:predicted DNA-binding protein with PD1-like motif
MVIPGLSYPLTYDFFVNKLDQKQDYFQEISNFNKKTKTTSNSLRNPGRVTSAETRLDLNQLRRVW